MAGAVLLTGATGFVGNRLHGPLAVRGVTVKCLSRNLHRARQRWPERDWVNGDVADVGAMTRAMAGCEVAVYLVHGLTDLREGWIERELRAAEGFARAAARAGVARIVYLGGVAPSGPASDHLRSRLETGDALRAGVVPCRELRAGMIVGEGSASWTIVRDLAARLPAMVLPAWLEHRSEPVAIDDVVEALAAAVTMPLAASEWWDLPGPEAITGVEVLRRVAKVMGRRPLLFRVPYVSPRLSSHWIRAVTRADHRLAAELVQGLTSDLVSRRIGFWKHAGLPAPMKLEEAALRALDEEAEHLGPGTQVLETFAKWLTRRA